MEKKCKKKDCFFNVTAPSLPLMKGKDSFHFSKQKKAVDQRISFWSISIGDGRRKIQNQIMVFPISGVLET